MIHPDSIIQLQNITVSFNNERTKVLDDTGYTFERGKRYAIVGQSGCGKSTLLHIIALLDRPTSGSVLFEAQDTSKMSDKAKTKIRNTSIGFVYQSYNLLYDFNAIENVAIPMIIAGYSKAESLDRAAHLIETVGLKNKTYAMCNKMSGGEQQRVAIARALVNNPSVIIADEPTGNLDIANGEKIFNLLLEVSNKNNATLIMATHNIDIANKLENIITINNMKITQYVGVT